MLGGDDARFIPDKPFHARIAGQLRFSTSQRVGPSRILIDHQYLEIEPAGPTGLKWCPAMD
jgi:hypothetical protein